jgi:hypothetical protein
MCSGFLWESPKERDHAKDRGVDDKRGTEWVLGRSVGVCGLDSTGSRYGPLAGCCECGDEPSRSGSTELVS